MFTGSAHCMMCLFTTQLTMTTLNGMYMSTRLGTEIKISQSKGQQQKMHQYNKNDATFGRMSSKNKGQCKVKK